MAINCEYSKSKGYGFQYRHNKGSFQIYGEYIGDYQGIRIPWT